MRNRRWKRERYEVVVSAAAGPCVARPIPPARRDSGLPKRGVPETGHRPGQRQQSASYAEILDCPPQWSIVPQDHSELPVGLRRPQRRQNIEQAHLRDRRGSRSD